MDVPHLTATGMESMSTLLYPLIWLLETSKFDHLEDIYINNKLILTNNIHLVTASLIIQQSEPAVGLVFHRTHSTQCYGLENINQNNLNGVIYMNFIKKIHYIP